MMKTKVALLLAALALFSGLAFAEPLSQDGMLIAPNSLNANVGIGYGYYWGLDVGGGVEYAIGKFVIAETVPFSYGVAGRVGIGLGSGTNISAAALGTVHFCWGALDLPEGLEWLGNVDSYIGLGVQILPGFGFASIGGSSYFLNKNLAINFEGGLHASYVGILFKF
jgi:hypothetical protein